MASKTDITPNAKEATPAVQAGDIYDRLHQAKNAFEAADALVNEIADNIAAHHNMFPNDASNFGPHEGMIYVMARLQGELETLEQEVEQLRAQLKADHQQAAE